MAFELLPVVHLERRRFPEYPEADPEAALTQLARQYERVALVDVEGVRTNEAELEFIQTASRRRSLWVDAGSRYATDAMDLFIAGADRVTMRWNTLRDAKELEEAASLAQPDALFVGLEYPRGAFLPHPKDARTAAEVSRLADELGVGVVLIADRADAEAVRALPPAVSRYLQGAPRAAVTAAQEAGFAGALLAPSELPAPESADPSAPRSESPE